MSIVLRPLEPASGQALARDLVLKTRRRKGLGDQIAVSKYLDDEFVVREDVQICGGQRSLFFFLACTIRFWSRGSTWVIYYLVIGNCRTDHVTYRSLYKVNVGMQRGIEI